MRNATQYSADINRESLPASSGECNMDAGCCSHASFKIIGNERNAGCESQSVLFIESQQRGLQKNNICGDRSGFRQARLSFFSRLPVPDQDVWRESAHTLFPGL